MVWCDILCGVQMAQISFDCIKTEGGQANIALVQT